MTIEALQRVSVESMKTSQVYTYAPEDTVRELKMKIFDNEGIPVEQQRLFAKSGWRNLWKSVEITDSSELLSVHLKTASKILLALRLRPPGAQNV